MTRKRGRDFLNTRRNMLNRAFRCSGDTDFVRLNRGVGSASIFHLGFLKWVCLPKPQRTTMGARLKSQACATSRSRSPVSRRTILGGSRKVLRKRSKKSLKNLSSSYEQASAAFISVRHIPLRHSRAPTAARRRTCATHAEG